MESEFLTIRQTSRKLGVPERPLRRLVREGRVPGFQCGDRFYIAVPELRTILTRTGAEAESEVGSNE